MKQLNEFLIPFLGLKVGKHQFEYQINNTFFDRFDYHEFESSDIKAKIVLEKKPNFLELSFKHSGTIHVPCDVTGEDFDLPIKGKINLVVQFGEQFNNDNEELLILPHGEHQLDVAHYLYEMIVLSIPYRKEHPGIKAGTLQTPALDTLKALSVSDIGTQEQETIDPRWDKLKQLLTDK